VRDGYGAMNPAYRVENGGLIKTDSGLKAFPNIQLWDYAARELQNKAREAPLHSEQAGLYNDLARQLKTELDKLVPEYRTAREGAGAFIGARNALEAGQEFASTNMDTREARLAMAKMSPTQRQLFQDGFVDSKIKEINASPDRRNVIAKLAQSPDQRQRLELALGPQRAKEFEAMLHVENAMDAARGAVQGNSTTAKQLAQLGLASGTGYTLGTGGDVFNPDPKAIAIAALAAGGVRGRQVINERVAAQVAKLLVSKDPQKINNAMKLIAASPKMLGSLRLTSENLASIAARGSVPSITVPRRPN
jgi:hypothetical protein